MASYPLPVAGSADLPSGYTPKEYSGSELHRLELAGFSGPLDLLLFLVHRDKIDISDIPVASITANYLECLDMMEDLDLEIAAEFLAMAAELIELKARMLLPKEESAGEEAQEEDPRKDLAARLMAYKEVKRLADALEQRPRLGRDTFSAGEVLSKNGPNSGFYRQLDPYLLIATLADVMRKSRGAPVRLMDLTHINMRKMMEGLLALMSNSETKSFSYLLPERYQTVEKAVHFLAILELAKIRMVRLYQAAPQQEIFVVPLYRDKAEAVGLLYSTLSIAEYDEEIL